MKASVEPLVSILMNCYNGEKYLREAIESVLAQTYHNWELIFWDNQSTDRSAEIFRSYFDKRLKYFFAPNHTLLYEARNCTVEKCSGSYIAFLDVDDYWEESKLEKQMGVFKTDPNVAMVYSNFYFKNEIRKTNKMGDGTVTPHQLDEIDWKVTLVETGLQTMTGGRVRRMRTFIGNETCLLSYGDGLSNIDINKLITFHMSHGKMVTVTAVHPDARFGELKMKGDKVISFQEKPQTGQGWINGGYFVIEPEFFELIKEDRTILEKRPLEQAAQMGELMAFRHEGFWQCMDTKRDRDNLEELWNSGKAPWKK